MLQTKNSDLLDQVPSSDRRVMLFDLSVRGHHPNYIRHLIQYWSAQGSGYLDIVVTPKFLQEHGDVVELADDGKTIQFIPIKQEEENVLQSRKNSLGRMVRYFQEWQLLCKYASKRKAHHCLILYLDTYCFPIAFGAKTPCSFSGIYFRPTFHYSQFSGYLPSWSDRLQSWREKLLLTRMLRNPQFKTVFCLDPFVVEHFKRFKSRATAVRLPDPVQLNKPTPSLEEIKNNLGIDRDRQVCLLFGALNGRKGIFQLLEAILKLSPQLCQKLCLLLVGESSIASQIEAKVAQACQAQPVQIIERYEFIPEEDVQAYFRLADVVLAPYQRHVGMSGILLLAAAAQKPVLSANYGLMGEIVRRYQLGLTVDSTRPDDIAQGLTQFLLEPAAPVSNLASMKAFVEQNSVEKFARSIFNVIA